MTPSFLPLLVVVRASGADVNKDIIKIKINCFLIIVSIDFPKVDNNSKSIRKDYLFFDLAALGSINELY